jgi:hypothetical protein
MQAYTPSDLAEYLYSSCYGCANGQSAIEIVEALTQCRSTAAAERRLRKAITLLRDQESHPICGTPATGYYYASTAEELEQSLEFLRSRALTSLRLLGKLKRRCLAALFGQTDLGLDLPLPPPLPPVEQWDLVGCPIRMPREIYGAVLAAAKDESFSRFIATAAAQRLLLLGVELSPETLSLVDKED